MRGPGRDLDRDESVAEKRDSTQQVKEHTSIDIVQTAAPIIERVWEASARPHELPRDWRSDATQLTNANPSTSWFDAESNSTFHMTAEGVIEAHAETAELGGLRVTAERAESGVQIVIRLDTAAAASALETQRAQLLAALQHRGIQVAGVQIVTGDRRGITLAARKADPSASDDASTDGEVADTESGSHGSGDSGTDRLNVKA